MDQAEEPAVSCATPIAFPPGEPISVLKQQFKYFAVWMLHKNMDFGHWWPLLAGRSQVSTKPAFPIVCVSVTALCDFSQPSVGMLC